MNRLKVLFSALAVTLALSVWVTMRDKDASETDFKSRDLRNISRSAAAAALAPETKVLQNTFFSRDPLLEATADPFSPVNFSPLPPVALPIQATPPPPPPPKAVAPPFSYRYVGRMTGVDGKSGVYLASDQELLSIHVGDMVANGFRIDAIGEKQISITYTPLDEHLVIPVLSAAP